MFSSWIAPAWLAWLSTTGVPCWGSVSLQETEALPTQSLLVPSSSPFTSLHYELKASLLLALLCIFQRITPEAHVLLTLSLWLLHWGPSDTAETEGLHRKTPLIPDYLKVDSGSSYLKMVENRFLADFKLLSGWPFLMTCNRSWRHTVE